MPGRLRRLLQLLGVNAVPAWGIFGGGWSTGTLLALYWCETLLVTVLVALRIALHRRLTHKRGHFAPPGFLLQGGRETPSGSERSTFMSSYATVAGGFAAAHGIFLLVLLGLLLPRYAEADAAVDTAALRGAVGAVALVLALGFTLDLVGLRERPFAWIRSLAEASMGRVLVVQMTILIGMPVMAYFGTPRSFLAVFVGLKVLVDLGSLIPRYEPQEAPRWLVRAMRPFGRGRRGDFAAYWRQRKAEERRRFADDEVTAAE